MTLLEDILRANAEYQSSEESKNLADLTSKPTRHIMVITCIDCRLIDLLEPAMGIKRGEANIVKTAGNHVPPGMNDTIKTVLVGIFELGVTEILIVGHYDCGVAAATKNSIMTKMQKQNIDADCLKENEAAIGDWLDNYTDPKANVKVSVTNLRSNKLIPKTVPIHGLVIDPDNGKLELVVDGYQV